MLIERALLDDVIAHAREEYDAECCGMIAYASPVSTAPGASPASGASLAPAVSGASAAPSSAEASAASASAAVPADKPKAVRVHRATNTFASRKRFEIDGREVLQTMNEFEDAGWDLGAIYHSHTHTAPYPSQTDINFAANWPGLEWVIIGLAGAEPEVRSYLIEDGQVQEVELEVR